MKDELQDKTGKRTYEKPQVTEVRLVAGEAVLATCKDAVGGITICHTVDLACFPASGSHS